MQYREPDANLNAVPAAPEEDEDLPTVVKRGQEAITQAAQKDPHTPLDSKAAQSYLTDLGTLADKYAPSAPPESQKSLAEAVSKANELYKSQANKNEWLEVAQILGRAGAQYAASQAGMANGGQYGRNMAAIDPGAGIDYNARTDRAARDRTQSVNEAKDIATADRQKYEDSQKAGAHKYEANKDYLHQGLGAALKEEADRVAEKGNSIRAARALRGEDVRDQRAIRAAKLHDLDVEQKEVAGQAEARQALANQMLSEGGMDSKTARKIQSSQPQLAAKAGVDLEAVANQMDKQETLLPGWAGGKTSEDETAGKRTILDSILGESKKKLEDIKARRAALLAQPLLESPGAAPAGKKTQAPPPADTKSISAAELAAYAAKHSMAPSAARKFLTDSGYKVE